MPINSSSFFAIIQLFSKLSSENNSTKMFIKILKSISSYVYRGSLSLFIAALKVLYGYVDKVKVMLNPLSLHFIHLHLKFILSAKFFSILIRPLPLLCGTIPLCWSDFACYTNFCLQTDQLFSYTSRIMCSIHCKRKLHIIAAILTNGKMIKSRF